MYVRDLSGNEYPVMASYTMSDEINGNMDISIEVLPNKVNRVFLSDLSEFWELVDDSEEVYKIVYCDEQSMGQYPVKNIRAIPKLYDDLNRTRVYERYEGSYAVEELFRIIFKPTGYSYRMIGAWNNIKIEGFGDGDTCLSMFQRVLKRIGAEFEFTGPSVTIRERIGSETDIMYRHRLNASNIVKEVDSQDYWTYARGYGDFREDEQGWENAKLKREYTSPLARILGKREAPPIKNANITKAATMDENLKSLVDNSIKISVTANLIDLRNRNYPYAQSNLGDTVFLIDENIQMDETVRVVAREITRNWKGDITGLNFTFGSEGMVARYQGKLNNAIKEITDILDGKKKLPFQAMSDEIQIVTKLLKSVQTQLVVGEDGSLIAIDKKNPNLIVILNAAGIGISDDGGQTFKNALTGRGLLADAIMANSITADHLAANAITVGFNSSSTNLKLFSNRLEFYRNNLLSAKINENGMEFWHGKRKIGNMGESSKKGNDDIRGISMQLETKGDFITWSYRKNADDDYFTSMLSMDPRGRYLGYKGIDIGLPAYFLDGIGMTGDSKRFLNFTTTQMKDTNYPSLKAEGGHTGIAFGTEYLYLIDNNMYYPVKEIVSVTNQLYGKNVAIATSYNSDGTANEWYNFSFK